jgi:N-ethylmaleimide reductase
VLGPSAIALNETMWTDQEGMQPYPVPIAMTEDDIQQTIEEFAVSAELAIATGFDGIELHGANGYLIDQFLKTASNQRSDQWGGSVENRARFAIEAARAVSERIGTQRTGIRLSPYGVFNGMDADAQTDALYAHLAQALSELKLLYIHIVDHSAMGAPEVPWSIKNKIREKFAGTIILSGGYDAERANADLQAGRGNLVAFGRPFIANPDLVKRLKDGTRLNTPDAAHIAPE